MAERSTRPQGGPAFHPIATGVYLALWAVLTVHGAADLIGGDPTERLYYPAWSAARLVNRDLELAEAVEADPSSWLRRFEAAHLPRDETLGGAISIFEDVARIETSRAERGSGSAGMDGGGAPLADSANLAVAELALLLAEAGERDALDVALEVNAPPGFADGLAYLYGASATPPDAAVEQFVALQLDGWTRDRALIQLALRSGESDTAERLQESIVERGARLRARSAGLALFNYALVVVGLLLIAWGGTRGEQLVPRATLPPPRFSLAVGLGVLIRADFWNRLFMFGLTSMPEAWSHAWWGELMWNWSLPLASLPLLFLVYRHLLNPELYPDRDPFRLALPIREWAGAAGIALAAISIDLVGTQALGWVAWAFGSTGHWSEGLDESLIWGGPWAATRVALDYVLWAPIFEEITFRGLLYLSLRKRFGIGTACLVSATVFGLVHFYSLPGFLTTFFSGIVWALAFERAHSLLPGIVAHAVYNLTFVLGLVLVYR